MRLLSGLVCWPWDTNSSFGGPKKKELELAKYIYSTHTNCVTSGLPCLHSDWVLSTLFFCRGKVSDLSPCQPLKPHLMSSQRQRHLWTPSTHQMPMVLNPLEQRLTRTNNPSPSFTIAWIIMSSIHCTTNGPCGSITLERRQMYSHGHRIWKRLWSSKQSRTFGRTLTMLIDSVPILTR